MNKKLKKITQSLLQITFFIFSIITLKAEDYSSVLETNEHLYGLYTVDILKMVLGIITIIGAFGFFITSSPRRAHWNPYVRRTFFGIFIFCNIIFQLVFNIINIPQKRRLVCLIGSCSKYFSGHGDNKNNAKDIEEILW